MVKNLPANAGDEGDTDSNPGLGRSPGGGNSNPFQYSWLINSMDRGAWWATVQWTVKLLSRVRLFEIPWTVAYQAPPSMELSRQKYWSGLPFPSSGDLPDLGIEPRSPALQADALPSEPPGKSPKSWDVANKLNDGSKNQILKYEKEEPKNPMKAELCKIKAEEHGKISQ